VRQRWLEKDRGYNSPCWMWQGATDSRGYAMAMRDGRVRSLHKWLWEELHGPVGEGLELDHLCRQRSCVNPDHLEAVSHAENVRRGATARLTPAQVEEIREAMRARDASGKRPVGLVQSLVEEYGVCRRSIYNVADGVTWT
jgi:hypothetical protein